MTVSACFQWAMSLLQPLWTVFATQAHMILPTLALFIVQAPFLLRVWGAVRHTSTLGCAKNDKSTWLLLAFWVLETIYIKILMPIAGFSIFAIFFNPDMTMLDIIEMVLVRAIPFALCVQLVVKGSTLAFGMGTLAVKRFQCGASLDAFVIRTVSEDKAFVRLFTSTLIGGAAVALCFYSFNWSNTSALVLVYLAALHSLSLVEARLLTSFPRIATMMFIFVFTAIGVIICWAVTQANPPDDIQFDSPEDAALFETSLLSFVRFEAFGVFLYTTSIVQTFISLCYRLDHHNYIQANQDVDETTQVLFLSYQPAGVVMEVPAAGMISTKFSKPYYTAAIISWCISNILVLALVAFEFIQLDYGMLHYGRDFAAMSAILAMPLMMMSLVGVAAIRGELKCLWTYGEAAWALFAVECDLEAPTTNRLSETEPMLASEEEDDEGKTSLDEERPIQQE